MDRIAELQQFIADFARILRVPQLADTGRPENDVEHSFGLALTCWYLAPKIAPQLNLEKILKYALMHDTVEIHAGDTFAFGSKELLDSKSDREDAAIERLTEEWPDFPEISQYAKGYKDKIDEEAKFVFSVDKMLPVLMINLGEKDKMWHKHKITLSALTLEKQAKMRVSSYVAPYFEEIVAWMSDPNYFYPEDPSKKPTL